MSLQLVCAELASMQSHDLGIGRANETEAALIAEARKVDADCLAAGTRIERGNLVALEIGHHEGGGGQCAIVLDDVIHSDAKLVERGAIWREVAADRSDQVARFAQERKRVADVSGDAAALLSKRVDQEADRDDVRFLRDDVVGE